MKNLTSKFLTKLLASGVVFTLLFANTAFADTESPSDVSNFVGTLLGDAVLLTWDAASDDTGVEGYVVHYGDSSVTQPGETYDVSVDVGDSLEYTATDLAPGETYYFSVVAYDAVGNESLKWAKEVSFEVSNDFEDTDSPQVVEAEALNMEEIIVEFSERVVLPDEDPQDAFTIENDATFVSLVVLDAEIYEDDNTGKTVLLTTEAQEADAVYLLTVGIDIEDEAGNPIISGTSDTALFDGSGVEKEVDVVPEIVAVEVIDATTILISFSDTVVLSIDPSEDFTIVAEDDLSDVLNVLGVELGTNNEGVVDASAIITTTEQSDATYEVTVAGVEGTETFEGMGTGGGDPEDTTPPLDVNNFAANSVLNGEDYTVNLEWDIPEESMGDVFMQVLYLSRNKGAEYMQAATLEEGEDGYSMGGVEPGEYWYRLTQKDAAGNESEGVVAKIILSETGPGTIGLVLGSLALGRVVGRRKREE